MTLWYLCVQHVCSMCAGIEERESGRGERGNRGGIEGKERGKKGPNVSVILYIQKGTTSTTVKKHRMVACTGGIQYG